MVTSFKDLAGYYDLIYTDKNYDREAEFIQSIISIYCKKPQNTLLELGCGTGNYTTIFSKMGYDITAIDLSKTMLDIAREKCDCELIQGDIKNFSLDRTFDVCVSMFAVLGYINSNENLKQSLMNARKHLKKGGLFIFDVWNGLAVIRHLPESRVKEMENHKFKVIRVAKPVLHSFDHVCEVNYNIIVKNKLDETHHEIKEKHLMRFFFPQEIKYYLEEVGFEVLKICPFGDIDSNVDENIWNMSVVSRVK